MRAPSGERRPITPTAEANGRVSFAKEKFAWLMQVARDPEAQYGLPLAVVLALEFHSNTGDGRCDPGDKLLVEHFNCERKIRRMRRALIDAGYLEVEHRTAGMMRRETANHVFIIRADLL